jgi:hypothetical protein
MISSSRSFVLLLVWLFLLRPFIQGYQIPVASHHRRQFLASWGTSIIGTGGIFIAAAVVGRPSEAQAAVAVLKSKGCYQGQGEACDELAGENAFIKSLQEKSAMNRSGNEREGKKVKGEALNLFFLTTF